MAQTASMVMTAIDLLTRKHAQGAIGGGPRQRPEVHGLPHPSVGQDGVNVGWREPQRKHRHDMTPEEKVNPRVFFVWCRHALNMSPSV